MNGPQETTTPLQRSADRRNRPHLRPRHRPRRHPSALRDDDPLTSGGHHGERGSTN